MKHSLEYGKLTYHAIAPSVLLNVLLTIRTLLALLLNELLRGLLVFDKLLLSFLILLAGLAVMVWTVAGHTLLGAALVTHADVVFGRRLLSSFLRLESSGLRARGLFEERLMYLT